MNHFCQSSDLIMPSTTSGPRTLYDKVFQDHVVDEREDGTILLYIGEYLNVHAVTEGVPLQLLVIPGVGK